MPPCRVSLLFFPLSRVHQLMTLLRDCRFAVIGLLSIIICWCAASIYLAMAIVSISLYH